MTTLAAAAKREKELYAPIITQMLRAAGLHVWEEATIRAGDEGTRTADHVAWRWSGDEIDALAVEVKAGSADVGLAQAVAYGVGFRRVYVVAEEALAATGYVAKVLDHLGLGYMEVTPLRALIELEAKDSAFLSQRVRDENVARIRLKHLWRTNACLASLTVFGKDRRGPIWGVTGTTREWQICVLLNPHSTHAWLSLIAESKSLGSAVASRLLPEQVSAAVDQLGDADVEVHLRRREYKLQPLYSDQRMWRQTDGLHALGDLLVAARALDGPNVGPWFEIRTDLWPHSARLTEEQAVQELRGAVDRMRPVRDSLNRMVGR